jgi:secreted trypsin-like serine protease
MQSHAWILVVSVSVAILGGGCGRAGSPTLSEEGDGARRGRVSAAIIGGTPANIDSLPGTVYLEDEDAGQFCGATLVAPDWALTAAHCLDGEPDKPFHVVIGRQRTSSRDGERIATSKSILHERFDDETFDNDIALVKLAKPSSGPIARLVTPEEWDRYELTRGQVTIAGWGATAEDGESSDALLEVNVSVVDPKECARRYAPRDLPVTANMLCAGTETGGKDACSHDSGGPLFASIGSRVTQVGIVSWGDEGGCGRAGVPGVYTRVAVFGEWLKQHSNGAVTLLPPEPTTTAGADGDEGTSASALSDKSEGAAKDERSARKVAPAEGCNAAPSRFGAPTIATGAWILALALLIVRKRPTPRAYLASARASSA